MKCWKITKKEKNTNLDASFNGPSNRLQVYVGIHLNLWTQPEKDSLYIWIHSDTSGYIRIRMDTFGDRRYIWIHSVQFLQPSSTYIFTIQNNASATLMYESVKAFMNRVRPWISLAFTANFEWNPKRHFQHCDDASWFLGCGWYVHCVVVQTIIIKVMHVALNYMPRSYWVCM